MIMADQAEPPSAIIYYVFDILYLDGDDLRRGRPTIHRMYEDMRNARMGIGASVFSGNILFCMAMKRVLTSPLKSDVANRIGAEILRANTEVNESQTLDVYMEGAVADRELWETMASKRAIRRLSGQSVNCSTHTARRSRSG